jgi:hypothetical protein
MKRKMAIIFSSLALLTVLVFYLPGLARAADSPGVPESCTLVNIFGKEISGYTLELAPNSPSVNGALYKWEYLLHGLDKKYVIQMNTLAPVCSPPPPIPYSTDPGGKVYNPGAGVPLTFFGYGDFQDYAISFPVKNVSSYSFYSNQSSPPQKTSIQINSLKGMFFCKEIAGPSCPNPLITSAASTFEEIQVNNNGDRVCLKKDPNFPCPVAVCCKDDESCTEGAPLQSADISEVLKAVPIEVSPCEYCEGSRSITPTPLTVGFAGVPEQACPKIILSVAGEGATWVCVGGKCFYK